MNAAWIKTVSVRDRVVVSKLNAHLDLGESEAIALALEQRADVLIIDEVAGRAVAKKLVNRIIGMIGILLKAKKAGLIGEVSPFLSDLRDTGFRMSDELFQFALREASELENEAKM